MPKFSASATFRVSPGTSGLLARVGTGLYDGVTAGCAIIESSSKEKCPVDTGALQGSIDSKVTRGIQLAVAGGPISSSLFAVQGVVAPHMEYAAYVEYGTGQRGAASPGAGEGPYNEAWMGQAAQPYQRPAMDENREAVIDTIRESVADALK